MFSNYKSILKREFSGYNGAKLSRDMMSGLTVAAVALPLALAFGVSCGADAAAGLVTAIIAGLVMSALSGASFQISGPTGAMTAVLITIVAQYSLQGVFIVCLMAGIILLAAGLLKLGKLVSIIPGPVITGFTSGIAVIIALGQIDNLFGTTSQGASAIEKLISYGRLGFHPNMQAVAMGAIVMLIMILWPKKLNDKIPSSLVGIIVAGVASVLLNLDVARVGEIPRTLLPAVRLNITQIDLSSMSSLIAPAITIAALGMIESLLCGASASGMKNEPFDADTELIAQGVGNILIPFFGGVPATAAIARTSVAIKSGCETRLTGIFHALGLLACMFVLGPVMAKLPLSALAGVLMMTAYRMNDWSAISYIFTHKFKTSCTQFLVTMACTIVFDLTVAILVGVLVSLALFVAAATRITVDFSKVENAKLKNSDKDVESVHQRSIVVYITGSLYFANVGTLKEALATLSEHDDIIFSLRGMPNIDMVGAEYFREVISHYNRLGHTVSLCGVQDRVRTLLHRVGAIEVLGEENLFWSADKAILARLE